MIKTNSTLRMLLLTSLYTLSSNLYADDDRSQYQHGEDIHKDHCYKCHTEAVYKREERFVKSINALGKQVRRCKDNTGAPWFDDDTDAVVLFLNKKYYKF